MQFKINKVYIFLTFHLQFLCKINILTLHKNIHVDSEQCYYFHVIAFIDVKEKK